MIKLYIYCLVLIIGNVEVGLDIGMKFHQEVMEIVSYDIYILYKKNMLSHTFIPLYMNIHSDNHLFLSSCIHLQYDNILKKSKKKMVLGMYIHIQSDIYPPPPWTITGHIFIHYNNSTSLSNIAMHFEIHYYQKCEH